jgi:hypothetical protein
MENLNIKRPTLVCDVSALSFIPECLCEQRIVYEFERQGIMICMKLLPLELNFVVKFSYAKFFNSEEERINVERHFQYLWLTRKD